MSERKIEFMMGKRSALMREVFGAKGVKGDMSWEGEGSASFVTPESLVYAGDFLSPGAERLWLRFCFLCQRHNPNTWICWPSREELAVMLGVSPRQITTYIREMVAKNVLYVRQRVDGTAHFLLRNIPESKTNRVKERLPKSERVTTIREGR